MEMRNFPLAFLSRFLGFHDFSQEVPARNNIFRHTRNAVQNPEHDGDLADAADSTLYYTTDANRNVTAVLDAAGNVVERYAYDAYGQATVLNGSAAADADVDGATILEWSQDADEASDVANAIRYCGYYYDAESGLHHVRNRMYHATLGQWIQPDPLGYIDGMNVYEYVGSGPIYYSDPMGLEKKVYGNQTLNKAYNFYRNIWKKHPTAYEYTNKAISGVSAVSPIGDPKKRIKNIYDVTCFVDTILFGCRAANAAGRRP